MTGRKRSKMRTVGRVSCFTSGVRRGMLIDYNADPTAFSRRLLRDESLLRDPDSLVSESIREWVIIILLRVVGRLCRLPSAGAENGAVEGSEPLKQLECGAHRGESGGKLYHKGNAVLRVQ